MKRNKNKNKKQLVTILIKSFLTVIRAIGVLITPAVLNGKFNLPKRDWQNDANSILHTTPYFKDLLFKKSFFLFKAINNPQLANL